MGNYKINLGTTENNKDITVGFDIASINLTLICGETGCGKSVFHTYLYKMLMRQNTADFLGFIFMDMTQVDFNDWDEKYLMMPTITDREKAIKVLERLSELKIRKNKHTFIHIEECDMFAFDQKRTGQAILNLKLKRPNIHIIYSTSSPRESVLSDELIAQADLKIIFKVASELDSKRLLSDDSAYNLKEVGEKIVDMKNWRNKLTPFSDIQVEGIESYGNKAKEENKILSLIQEELDKLTSAEIESIRGIANREIKHYIKIDKTHEDYENVVEASLWMFIGAKLLEEEKININRFDLVVLITEKFSLSDEKLQNLNFYLGGYNIGYKTNDELL